METLLPEDKYGQTPSRYWLLQRFICFSSSAHLYTPRAVYFVTTTFCVQMTLLCEWDSSLA